MSWEDYSVEQNKKNPFENHACGFRQGKEYQIIMEKTEIPVIDVIIPAYRPDDSFHKLIRLLLEQSEAASYLCAADHRGRRTGAAAPGSEDVCTSGSEKGI